MDAFSLIQHFFTRMNCQFCEHAFERQDIELLRREEGLYVVNVFCHHCNTQNGVALVGVETGGVDLEDLDPETIAELELADATEASAAVRRKYGLEDPELTDAELERLAKFKPISADDVIEAHDFFKNLDGDWMRFIPEEMRQSQTALHTESPAE